MVSGKHCFELWWIGAGRKVHLFILMAGRREREWKRKREKKGERRRKKGPFQPCLCDFISSPQAPPPTEPQTGDQAFSTCWDISDPNHTSSQHIFQKMVFQVSFWINRVYPRYPSTVISALEK